MVIRKIRLAGLFASIFFVGIISGMIFRDAFWHRAGHFLLESTSGAHFNENRVSLKTRKIVLSRDANAFDSEQDSKYVHKFINVKPSETALLLIDVWDMANEPNDGWSERATRHTKNQIVPLITLARKKGIKIFHAYHGAKCSSEIVPQDNEIMIGYNRLPRFLKTVYFTSLLWKNNIKTLLVAGYSTHKCIFFRPVGIYELSKVFSNIILVRDATLAFDYTDREESKFVFTSLIEEEYGCSTTLDDLKLAFDQENLLLR